MAPKGGEQVPEKSGPLKALFRLHIDASAYHAL